MAENLVVQAGYFLNTIQAPLLTRPANTTAYALSQAVSAATVAVTAASNATPSVITSAAHCLSNGDMVTIAAVGGNTNANGNWLIIVLDANTFSLVGSSGNGAYTARGPFQRAIRLANAARR